MVKKFKVSKTVSTEPSLIIYDQLMLTPGLWNGVKFTSDQIKLGIEQTDWSNPENFALIDSHPKNGQIPNSLSWQGYFDKISYKSLEDGVSKEGMYGDLYIYDPVLASKLLSKKSPLAVSIDASYRPTQYGASSLSFTNTALVYRPGCKDAYIQLEDQGENAKMRIICQEDVSLSEVEDEISSVKLNYELTQDKIVAVYDKEDKYVFEGSVLTFNKDEEGNIMVSIMNPNDEIKEFLINEFMFIPIMPSEDEEIMEEAQEQQEVELESDFHISKKEDNEIEKMNSNNIESLEARISLIEEKLGLISLSEETEDVAEEEAVKEESEVKESEELVEEIKEEVIPEETKETIEEPEVVAKSESTEVVETEVEVSEESDEVENTELEEVTTLKAKVAELEAKLAEKNAPVEEVKLESKDERKVAQSKTVVQLESTEVEEPKVQLSKFEAAIARLNELN